MSPYMKNGTIYAEEIAGYRFDDNERRRDHLRRSVISLGMSITRFLSRYARWRTVLAAVSLAALPATFV